MGQVATVTVFPQLLSTMTSLAGTVDIIQNVALGTAITLPTLLPDEFRSRTLLRRLTARIHKESHTEAQGHRGGSEDQAPG